jgi:serine/threonine protein kinase
VASDHGTDQVEALVAAFVERREAGETLTAEAFAAEHPEYEQQLLPALRACLEAMDLFPDPEGALPASIGGYRVLRELGRGGMGVVFEVEREAQHFALKLLPIAAGPRASERFRREAAALRKLDHPGIAAIRDTGTDHGAPFLVMDLVRGQGLEEFEGPMAPRNAAALVRDLARIVQAAHDTGVLHRDLKPQNVILRDDGQVV